MSDQLPLHLHLRDDATLDSYYPASNEEAWKAVTAFSHRQEERFLYLWGQPGVGRTHLLQAACDASEKNGHAAVYIPLSTPLSISPSILGGLEHLSCVCIDDLEHIAGNAVWEEALFHLFNRLRERAGSLLVSANVSPHHLPVALPDLRSRLSWGVVYHLHSLTDEEKLAVLQMRAQMRGLHLNETVGQFLLQRCTRDMRTLYAILDLLDKASLAEQRRLTVPFIKHVLNV